MSKIQVHEIKFSTNYFILTELKKDTNYFKMKLHLLVP